MSITDLPLFDAIKQKLHWLTDRQRLLAENVANANTPGYGAKDLKRPDFASAMRGEASSVALKTTSVRHLSPTGAGSPGVRPDHARSWEVAPDGNSVRLEQQMIKVHETATEYRLATSLYSKSTGLIKMALGSGR